MDTVKLSIEGIDKLLKKLEPDKLIGTTARRVLGKAGYLMRAEAKKAASSGRPGPFRLTGNLRNRIWMKLDKAKIPLWVKVFPVAPHAHLVEKGHKQQPGRYVPVLGMKRIGKGEGKGKYRISQGVGARLVATQVKGYPFMIPTFEKMKGRLDGILEEGRKIIEGQFGL